MKTIKNNISFMLMSLVLLLTVGCDSFFDVNDDPNNPLTAASAPLLTNSQLAIVNSLGLSNGGLSSHTGVFMHQISRRGAPDQYGSQGGDFAITTSWQSFYDIALEDLKVLINQSEESGDLIYAGIAKILKAYTYSVMVDVWGDIPFTEANSFPDVLFPTFDNGADVYPQLITLLNDAIANLENTDAANINTPGADDLIYGGSASAWVTAAKSIKLKLLNQVRLVNVIPDAEAQIVALVAEGDLIDAQSDDFELLYGTSNSPDNRHPAFITDYAALTKTYYISIWLYEIMTGKNSDILNGVNDPRVPYYWFNQLTDITAVQNPYEYAGGTTLDGNGEIELDGTPNANNNLGDPVNFDGFLSIHFGSTHPNQAQNQNASQSVLGLYPAGGRYDDGSGGSVTASLAAANPPTGDVPERILTSYTMEFIMAELALDGVIPGGASQAQMHMINGIRDAFAKVNQVATNTASTQVIPTISTTDIDAYIAAVDNEYAAAASDDRRLEIIMTQKWLSSFGNSMDQYVDYRRRGYPVIFDPNNDQGRYAATTQSGRNFLVSMPYRDQDISLNPNAPAQRNGTTDRVFWDPN